MASRWSIASALEWFIPPSLRENPDTYRRAHMYVGAHVFGPPLGHLIAIYLFFVDAMPGFHLWVLVAALALYYPCPLLLRWGVNFTALALLSVQNLAFIVLSAAFSYGGASSPFMIWMPVVPLLAFFYLGARPTMRMVVLSLLALDLAAFYAIHLLGYAFPKYVPTDNLNGVGIFSVLVAVIFVSIMSIYYERVAILATEIKAAHIRAESERQQAEAASQAKSEFLARVSHELRTPLNAVLGFAQLLEVNANEPLTVRQARQIGQIRKSGHHLLALIDEILDLSKIEAGTIRVSIERVPLGPVFDQVRATLTPLAEAAEVSLMVHLAPDIPAVRADRIRLVQVLINLGTNAIKYNYAGGQATLVAEAADPGWVRLSMIDTGIGIPQQRQTEMFQPFNRLGAEASLIEGSGIGLAIAQRLVQLMNGRLSFHSAPDKGSTFTVELPMAPPLAEKADGGDEAAVADRAAAVMRHRDGARYTLLYVEDNPSNIALMQELVDALPNARLLTATDAGIGLALARAHRPDVIVLDINLPGMNGFDALRELKRAPLTAAIPVMALTAAAAPHDIERGKAAGFTHYLTKPIDVQQFLAAIDSLLKIHGEA